MYVNIVFHTGNDSNASDQFSNQKIRNRTECTPLSEFNNHFHNTLVKPKVPALHERLCNELLKGLNEKICVLQRKQLLKTGNIPLKEKKNCLCFRTPAPNRGV